MRLLEREVKLSNKDNPVLPRRLITGQTIGVVALSSACEEKRFQAGVRYLESLGFRVKVALDPCRYYGSKHFMFSSDSAQNRAQALHALFADSEVSAIVVARGAYGSMEVLPLIDFKLVRDNCKLICGFSDATAVLSAIYQHAGIVALHGPSLESAFSKAALGDEAGLTSSQALLSCMRGETQPWFAGLELSNFAGSSAAEGPLTGGNLTILSHLMGTPWEPEFSEHIVFLEETGEPPYRVHRMLLQLKIAGKFAGVRGIFLGRFSNCVHAQGLGPSLDEVLKDIFKDYAFPVLGFAPFGHSGLNYPLPYGVRSRISAQGLEILGPIVQD